MNDQSDKNSPVCEHMTHSEFMSHIYKILKAKPLKTMESGYLLHPDTYDMLTKGLPDGKEDN